MFQVIEKLMEHRNAAFVVSRQGGSGMLGTLDAAALSSLGAAVLLTA